MKHLVSPLLIGLSAVALIAAGPSVKEQMKTVVEPASSVLFAVGGEADPSNDPKTVVKDARWQEAADAAAKLKAVAGAMMQPDQVKPGETWMTTAKQLADLADRAGAAAKAKDGAKLAQVANDLGDNCTACHSKYKPQT